MDDDCGYTPILGNHHMNVGKRIEFRIYHPQFYHTVSLGGSSKIWAAFLVALRTLSGLSLDCYPETPGHILPGGIVEEQRSNACGAAGSARLWLEEFKNLKLLRRNRRMAGGTRNLD